MIISEQNVSKAHKANINAHYIETFISLGHYVE